MTGMQGILPRHHHHQDLTTMIAALTNASAASVSSRPAARPSSEELFKQLDADNKGYLTQDDLVKISLQGAQAADAADATNKAAETFAKMDADGDGKVSQTEFKAAEPKDGPNDANGAKGAPPAGGKGGPPSAGASASAASSSKTYEAADANEDGKVTQPEQLAYDAEQALKTYTAVAQAE